MSKLVIHKDKEEEFNCDLLIEGANISDTIVRLCLEFSDRTLFFNGNLHNDGSCDILIPKLKDISESTGTLYVEVIANDTYFRVYDDQFELKKSVEAKINESQEGFLKRKVEKTPKPSVKFAMKPQEEPEVIEEPIQKIEEKVETKPQIPNKKIENKNTKSKEHKVLTLEEFMNNTSKDRI